jgi:predicted kinase
VSTLVIPDPSLVVLVGAAGAGKSTLAARLFAPDEIVSSDALRAVVSGDEDDQTASKVAFRILHRTVDGRLGAGRLTVVDATNLAPAARRPLIRRAHSLGFPAAAIVLDLDAETVLAQNAARRRIVDPEVVDRHLAAIRTTVDGGLLALEGFDPVVILRSPIEAAALIVVRRGPGVSA